MASPLRALSGGWVCFWGCGRKSVSAIASKPSHAYKGAVNLPALQISTRFATLISSVLIAAPLLADSDKPRLGWVEYVSLQPWGIRLKAKLDTGAKTSSMHAKNLRFFERNDEEWVVFTYEAQTANADETHFVTIERPVVRRARIKQRGEDIERRPVVTLDICLNGTEYTEQFTLTDRSNFLYPMLLGRRALKEIAAVDAAATFVSLPDCAPE